MLLVVSRIDVSDCGKVRFRGLGEPSQVAESSRYRNRLIMFAQINFANVRYWHLADIQTR
jgi:hypothetical protein